MDRFYLETPRAVAPDEESEQDKLLVQTGDEHEQTVLKTLRDITPGLVEIAKDDDAAAAAATLEAIRSGAPIIYQAALHDGLFAGFADFLQLGLIGKYEVWDTKLARSPRPYYAIQLCCYSEMLGAVTGEPLPEKFGIILGTGDRLQFRVEDFTHYYRHIKATFLAMQGGFTGNPADCPDPLPTADHGRWSSHAQKFFTDKDHVVQTFGISVGQIKKLKTAGVTTLAELAASSGKSVQKLDPGSLEKLVAQARLQAATLDDRKSNPDSMPRYELLPQKPQLLGLAALPLPDAADVFFDMEGYPDPLAAGGLEYLFGAAFRNGSGSPFEFKDWWAHDRDEEKRAFEGFVDWAYARWKQNPGMHIYHYAAYEVSALRRLSTRHDTRQEQVDDLLRNGVLVDLYQVVRHGLRIGEANYKLKTIEILYRPKRSADVKTAVDSIVQYGHWIESGEVRDWKSSPILEAIREYNRADCESNAGLADWLRKIAAEHGVSSSSEAPLAPSAPARILPPNVVAQIARREKAIADLRAKADAVSVVLADLVNFHRREEKPIWWRMHDRKSSTDDELRDDSGCIQGVKVDAAPIIEKRSLVQRYKFDPSQECKLTAGEKKK